MHGRYNRLKAKAASERGRRMAAARWNLDRQRRDNDMPARIRDLAQMEIENLPRKEGDALGCLQWTDFRSGKVRRWVIRIGNRVDRVTVEIPGTKPGKSHGWTWVMNRLRSCLCGNKPPSSL